MAPYWILLFTALNAVQGSQGLQMWLEQPTYQEVNPQGNIVIPCRVQDKKGECRWERDGSPVGIYIGKYEWAGQPEIGDCSLRLYNASLEYDDGVWQCQVTPSSFTSKDALISEGAKLVVRESPTEILIQRVGDEGHDVTASAGEDVELECIVSGGNPPAKLRWFLTDQEIFSGHRQENTRASPSSRTWVSISRLTLPVSKGDNGAVVRCVADHPTLESSLSAKTQLTIHYSPTVSIETSPLDYLEEKKDPVSLRCISDSNPPSAVVWRKEGLPGIFSADADINYSPVTRHTAGVFSCEAENALGRSKPAYVEIDVKFAPSILSVGPAKVITAEMNGQTVLNCEAEGNPAPRYQWLQKLPTNEVLIRGYEQRLVIRNVTYDHQGEFVCKATNVLRGEERSVQSEPIRVQVSGKPQVMRYSAQQEVRARTGEEVHIDVLFCADPMPKQAWHLGDLGSGSGNNIILAAGTGHERFMVNQTKPADREDCYISTLIIHGAHVTDSHGYQLKLTNEHGSVFHDVRLIVQDHVPQGHLIAVGVGVVLIVLLLLLICLFCCKSESCCACCCSGSGGGKKDFKPTDLESDRTDVESTHSSNVSRAQLGQGNVVIPPDALYAAAAGAPDHHVSGYFHGSKESLKPDVISTHSHSPVSNLNRTQSTSGGDLDHMTQQQQQLQQLQQQQQALHGVSVVPPPLQSSTSTFSRGPPRIVYNDLCFPKTSNYGSMKMKRKNQLLYQQQQQQQQRPSNINLQNSSSSTAEDTYRSGYKINYAHNGLYSQ